MQVTSVPFDAYVAVRLNDIICPPLGTVTDVCEDGGNPRIKIKILYPVTLVAHSNVTVSLTYTYCVSGTIVKIFASKIYNNYYFDDITLKLTRHVNLGDHNYSKNPQKSSHNHGGVTLSELKVWCNAIPQTIIFLTISECS